MKIYIYTIFTGCCLALTSLSTVSAQNNLMMQAAGLPQNMSLNPALAPAHSYISFPLIGSLDVRARNSFSYKNVITNRSGVKYLDTQKLLSALKGNNNITSVNLTMDILTGGFYVSDNDFIGLNLSTKIHVATNLPRGMFEFLLDNPLSETDRLFNMSMTPNIIGWNELGVSYSRVINDNFRVGGRVKYLMGMVGVQSDGITFNMQKNSTGYTLSSDYNVKFGNYNLANENSDIADFTAGLLRNPGVAADLGLEYVSTDRHLTVAAGVSDLGAIFWNAENSSQLVARDPHKIFNFDGFGKLQGMIDGKTNFGSMIDSVFTAFSNTTGVDTLSGQRFSTMIPTRYHALVEYSIGQNFRHNVSVQFLGIRPFKGAFDYQLSAGYCYRPKTGRWQLMTNYTYRPSIPVAVGLAGMYTSRRFQLYLGCENILPCFGLQNIKNVGFQLGINFFMR